MAMKNNMKDKDSMSIDSYKSKDTHNSKGNSSKVYKPPTEAKASAFKK
jgi:hypothetical protein